YKDSPRVYYQSYASYVKHTLGDNLLSIPNLLMFLAGAPKNDGLVSIESAQWGHFKKTFVSTGRRGISHGDMIDLKREDYKGFDVIEAYIQIVSELKNSGY
ncbi:MAG: triacylglycerol lipase, partial [Lachnospiraceae bacterium]|nr:triacylglycerol lipase [Lachnospiraceae bacterium]